MAPNPSLDDESPQFDEGLMQDWARVCKKRRKKKKKPQERERESDGERERERPAELLKIKGF